MKAFVGHCRKFGLNTKMGESGAGSSEREGDQLEATAEDGKDWKERAALWRKG